MGAPAHLDYFKDKIEELSTKAEQLIQDTSRPWSGDDGRKKEVDNIEAEIKEYLERANKLDSVKAVQKQFGDIAAANTDLDGRMRQIAAKSLGEQFTDSDAYKSWFSGESGTPGLYVKMGGKQHTSAVELKAGGILGETNFAGTESGSTSTSGGAGLLVPQYLRDPVLKLYQRLTVEDLMPGGTLAGSSLIYPVETTATNNAAFLAEGGLKPLSDLGITTVTETLKKAATRLKISDEMIQDVPFIQSYVNGRLLLFVQIAVEAGLLKGNGSGANMLGIQARSGLQTPVALVAGGAGSKEPSAQTKLEAIYQQITNVRVNAFLEPDGIVIDPVSWQQLRIAKDANGQYFGGGPFTGAYGNGAMIADNSVLSAGGADIWSLRTVVTAAQTAGTALVGAFQGSAQVFSKGGLTIEATNSNQDDFDHNLISIRAERRLMLAVYRPGGFGLVTGLNVPPTP